ncbi:hypothetical protein [uncultured Cloacibacillus sp.]|uniref:LPD3 domain-containing protein n=1 Tax=uncultured Cloacibacillus sp. TaxID=889794 RepID=UPI00320AC219
MDEELLSQTQEGAEATIFPSRQDGTVLTKNFDEDSFRLAQDPTYTSERKEIRADDDYLFLAYPSKKDAITEARARGYSDDAILKRLSQYEGEMLLRKEPSEVNSLFGRTDESESRRKRYMQMNRIEAISKVTGLEPKEVYLRTQEAEAVGVNPEAFFADEEFYRMAKSSGLVKERMSIAQNIVNGVKISKLRDERGALYYDNLFHPSDGVAKRMDEIDKEIAELSPPDYNPGLKQAFFDAAGSVASWVDKRDLWAAGAGLAAGALAAPLLVPAGVVTGTVAAGATALAAARIAYDSSMLSRMFLRESAEFNEDLVKEGVPQTAALPASFLYGAVSAGIERNMFSGVLSSFGERIGGDMIMDYLRRYGKRAVKGLAAHPAVASKLEKLTAAFMAKQAAKNPTVSGALKTGALNFAGRVWDEDVEEMMQEAASIIIGEPLKMLTLPEYDHMTLEEAFANIAGAGLEALPSITLMMTPGSAYSTAGGVRRAMRYRNSAEGIRTAAAEKLSASENAAAPAVISDNAAADSAEGAVPAAGDGLVFLGQDAVDTFFQSNPEAAEDVAVSLGITEDSVINELGEIAVKRENFEKTAAEHPEFAKSVDMDVRDGARGVTKREAAERLNRKLQDPLEQSDSYAKEAVEVRREISSKLREAGMDDEASVANADLYSRYLYTLGKRLNMSPKELHRLRVESGDNDGPAAYYQTAWHGSPFRFDRFSTENIGTGEGAQAFGWGLYFAGNKKVSEWYRDNLTRPKYEDIFEIKYDGRNIEEWWNYLEERVTSDKEKAQLYRDCMEILDTFSIHGNPVKTINEAKQKRLSPEAIEWFDKTFAHYKIHPGALYKVDIPDDGDYLLWDRDVPTEQADKVFAALENKGVELPKDLLLDGRSLADSDAGALTEMYGGDGAHVIRRIKNEVFYGSSLEEAVNSTRQYYENEKDEASESRLAWLEENKDRFSVHDMPHDALVKLWGGDGRSFYEELSDLLGSDREASLLLKDAGIPGIKYLDGNSRYLGEGSYNYVIFDDADVNIAETYYQQGANAGENLRRAMPDKVFNSFDAARAYLREQIKKAEKGVDNESDGITVSLAANGIKKMLSEKATEKSFANGFTLRDHITAVANILKLYKNSELLFTQEDEKQRPNVTQIKRFGAPVVVPDGQDAAIAYITVREVRGTDNNLYSVELVSFELLKAEKMPPGTLRTSLTEEEIAQPTGGTFNVSESEDNVNSEEAVSGEPASEAAEASAQGETQAVSSDGFARLAEKYEKVNEELNRFYQSAAKGKRGGITFNRNTGEALVTLFRTADRSTFIHEMGHLILDDLIRYGYKAEADTEISGDLKTVLDYLGVSDMDLSDLNSLDDSQRARLTEAHEKWARAMETYVMTGEAPSKSLRSIFKKMRMWLLEIYSNAKFAGEEITPEVQDVFDRLLATPQEMDESYSADATIADLLQEIDVLQERISELEKSNTREARNKFRLGEALGYDRGRSEGERGAKFQRPGFDYKTKSKREAMFERLEKRRAMLRDIDELLNSINHDVNDDKVIWSVQQEMLTKLKESRQIVNLNDTELDKKRPGRRRRKSKFAAVYPTERMKMAASLMDAIKQDLGLDYRDINPKDAPFVRLIEKLEASGMTLNDLRLSDAKLSEIAALAKEINEIHDRGRREYEVWRAGIVERRNKIRTECAEDLAKTESKIKSGPVSGSEDLSKQYDGIRGQAEKLKDWTYANTLGAIRLFDWIGHGQGKFNSAFSKHCVDEVNAAYDTKLKHIHERHDAMNEKMKSLGITLHDLSKKRRIGGHEYSVDELLSIYTAMQNDKSSQALIYGNMRNLIPDEWFKENAKALNAPGNDVPAPDAVLAHIGECIKALTPKEKELADYVVQEYDANYERMNDIFIVNFNQGMLKEENYTPMHRLEYTSNHGLEDADEAAYARGLAEQAGARKAGLERGFLNPRVIPGKEIGRNRQAPIQLGLLSIWNTQVDAMEHTAAFAQIGPDLHSVFTENFDDLSGRSYNLPKLIREKFGAGTWRAVQEYINLVNSDRLTLGKSVFDKLGNFLGTNMAYTYLAANLGTVLKQTTSIPRFIVTAGPAELANAVAEYVRHPKQFLEDIYAMDPQMRDRLPNAFFGLDKYDPTVTASAKYAYKKTMETLIAPISYMDRVVAAIGWKATFDSNIKKKLSREQAIRAAQRAVLLTQQTPMLKDAPMIWRQSGLARLMMIFTSDAAPLLGMTAYDMAQAIKRGEHPEALRSIAACLICAVAMKAIVDGMPDDDNDESWTAWVLSAFTKQTVESIPLVGKELMSFWESFSGQGYNGTTYSAFVAPLSKILKGYEDVTSEDPDEVSKYTGMTKFERGIWNIVEGMSLITAPLPVVGAKRLYLAAQEAGNGDFLRALQSMIGQRKKIKQYAGPLTI